MTRNLKKWLSAMMAIMLATTLAFSYGFTKKSDPKKETSKSTEVKRISYKWFQISSSVDLESGDPVPSAAANYLGEGEEPPAGTGCGGDDYQCVSGFNDNQVNAGNQLIGNNQVAQDTPHLRN